MSDGAVAAPDAPLRPPATGECAQVTGVQITRIVQHLGGGQEVTLRLEFRDGVPLAGRDLRGCLEARDGTGKPLTAQMVVRSLASAHTTILIDPGTSAAETKAARDAMTALIKARPADERIALFRWGAEVTQMASLWTDRALSDARLGVGLGAAVPAPKALGEALTVVATAITAAGGPADDRLRTIGVVSPREVRGAAGAPLAAPNLLLWLVPREGELKTAVPDGLRFAWEAMGGLAMAATALSRRIDAYKGSAHVALGVCAGVGGIQAEVRATGAQAGTAFDLPSALPENLGPACDPAAAAAGKRTFTKKIDLQFTPEQRTAANAAVRSMADFPLSVKVSPEHKPVAATAHYRGRGSYDCQRKNYTIDLAGKAPRYLMPGSGTTKLLLLSNCSDRHYIRNFIAFQMMAGEGLFTPKFDYVEVLENGQTRGVYTLVEKVDSSLKQHFSMLTSVIRRNNHQSDHTEEPAVKESIVPEAAALQTYKNIVGSVRSLTGAALDQGLRARLDLDQYMLWIAMMNLLDSGDYIDEVYFYSTQSTGADGKPVDFFQTAGWDQDGIFRPTGCHSSSQYQFADARGLVVCAEAELDKKIFAEPIIYARYVDVLQGLIDRTPTAKFEQAVTSAVSRLSALVANPGVLSVMRGSDDTYPISATTAAGAADELKKEGAALVALFDEQRKKLISRIMAYRAKP